MITYLNDTTYQIYCLSSDQKPLLDKNSNGSYLLELDTGIKYCYDFDNKVWNIVPTTSGGGGGGGVSPSTINAMNVKITQNSNNIIDLQTKVSNLENNILNQIQFEEL